MKKDLNKSKAKLIEELQDLRRQVEDLQLKTGEKHSIESELKKSEKKFRELVELLPQPIYEMDINGNFKFTNQRGFQVFGYTQDDIDQGVSFLRLFIPEDRERVKHNIRRILNGNEMQGNEYTALKKDGSTFQALFYSNPIIHDGHIDGLRGVVIDITDRKYVEKELEQSRDQFRNLSAHLQTIREEERSYIAREIHDELGQALTALKMDLSWLQGKLSSSSDLCKKIDTMTQLVDLTIQSVRRISTDLRPGLLDDLGLIPALEWYSEEFQNRAGIECRLQIISDTVALDQDRSIAIFRIFQETLTNVARHARASEVIASLKQVDHSLEMIIKDNGIGISEEQIKAPTSLGLIGLKERVYPWGGTVEIYGIPHQGTTVKAVIPLAQEKDI
jgi:two-component system sensor histidine kinase UhpB